MDNTPIYRIKDWDDHFEKNRTRELKHMRWVAIPNKHDGDGYTDLIMRDNGANYFAVWILLIQVASKCDPRGTLIRDNGKPHDASSLSRKTRLSVDVFKEAMPVLLEIGWIEVVTVSDESSCDRPHGSATLPQLDATIHNITEHNRTERTDEVISYLNKRIGTAYKKDSEEAIKAINERLKDGYTINDFKKVINAKADAWETDKKMAPYLRPKTLFGSNFESYLNEATAIKAVKTKYVCPNRCSRKTTAEQSQCEVCSGNGTIYVTDEEYDKIVRKLSKGEHLARQEAIG